MDAARVVALGMQLYAAGDFDRLRRHVHPDAEVQMAFLHGDVARGPDGLAQALRSAAGSLHRPRMDGIEAIDEHAAVMVGRVRYPIDGGGFGDRPAAWLNVVRDGLIWRVRVFNDVVEARQAYTAEYLPQLLTTRVRGAGELPQQSAPA